METHDYALAGIYRAQGSHAKVEQLYSRALNLAQVYRSSGRYADAESRYAAALAILERVRGPEDPSVTAIRRRLASLSEWLNGGT